MASSRLLSAVLTAVTVLAAVPATAQMNQAWSLAREGQPCRLLLASDGDVIVAARLLVSGPVSGAFYDSVLARYSPGGQLRWLWQSGEAADDRLADIALDAQGNILAVGEIGTSSWGQAPFVTRLMKFSPLGQRLWTSTHTPNTTGLNSAASGVRVSPDGSVYIFGQDYGAGTERDVFIARYSAGGVHQWNFRRSGPIRDFIWDLVLDAESNAYWAGSTFRPGTSLNGGCLGKVNSQGQQSWIWLQPVVTNVGGALYNVSLDGAGDVVATGYAETFPGYQDGMIVKAGPQGAVAFHHFWDGPFARWDRFWAHTILSDNSIAVSGDTYVSDGFEYYDVPTIRYSSEGQVMWSDIYGSTLFQNNEEEWSQNMITLPGDQILTISTDWSRPGYDYALHRYAPNGELLERRVHVLPAGTADIKDIPSNCAAYDSSANAVYLLGWGAGPSSNPIADHLTLIRVNLPGLVPASGDIDGDGDVDGADLSLFAAVLLGSDGDPGHVTRADLNADGASDGRDCQPFVNAMIGG